MATALIVMAKAPVPGRVKTRLVPPLTPAQAARLAAAFLADTWAVIAAAAAELAGPATAQLARAGDVADFPAELRAVPGFAQARGDLGARLEHAAGVGLAEADAVVVVGSDLPGLRVADVRAVCEALAAADAVLAPSGDGGFWALGLRRCAPGLLADLPWSHPGTRAACRARLAARGHRVASGPAFDDVDEPGDLIRLRQAIAAGVLRCPRTAAVLEALP